MYQLYPERAREETVVYILAKVRLRIGVIRGARDRQTPRHESQCLSIFPSRNQNMKLALRFTFNEVPAPWSHSTLLKICFLPFYYAGIDSATRK